MTELEIMIHAKAYIDSLAKGVDPLSGQELKGDDIVNNVRISRCLFYVSGILQKVIDNGGEIQRKKLQPSQRTEFALTEEQKMNLTPEDYPQSSAKITATINAQIDEYAMKKLKVTTLNNWLVSIGLLQEITTATGRTRKISTPDGETMGIQEKIFSDQNGTHKYCVYNRNAQQFIFDNIDAIVEFAHQEELNKQRKDDTEPEST
ncbi:MAG: hypothetical protein J1F11_12125 [Oscillospiraceae bacterium]|nr:hypothetical protein [Oscillospiraceae bacterium]